MTKDTGCYSLPFSPNPIIFRFYTGTKVIPYHILLPLSISSGFLLPNFHFFAYPEPPVPPYPHFPLFFPFPIPYAYCTLLIELT